MATPSKQPGATPTHLTSSPRPSGPSTTTRPISHKSPLTRTPSASGQQPHSQQHPNTSHQYSTPLAATTTGIDDPVTFSSPSALLALGGYAGISPSPAAQDGLVAAAAGLNENDIQAFGMSGLKLGSSASAAGGGGGVGTARDGDEERRRHVEEVVQILRPRVVGRGVCREGVERLARLEGFESIWQEDNINIAGNFVDLEVEFYSGGGNTVRDVSLRYATPGATEGERREEATAVLVRDLVQSPGEGERGVWKSLGGFYENLRWLAKLDRLSQEVNCFEAIEGLYECLKRVWDEEGKVSKSSGIYERLCNGWIGRPRMHKRGRIGLSLDYWVDQARVLDAKQKWTSPDAMAVDQPSQVSDEEEQLKMWGVLIECEEGYPSLRVSKEWVEGEVLTSGNPNQESNESADASVTVVNWADPPPTSVNDRDANAMELDTDMMGPSPNRRFVAKVDPPLDVPILAASEIYRQLGIQLPQEFKMVTYDGLLVPGWCPGMETGGEGPPQVGRRKRKMSVDAFDVDGKPCRKQHSYTFQTFESVAGRTMRDIPFSHPRQLVDIFSILRQYAVLASMIRKVFCASAEKGDSATGSGSKEARSAKLFRDIRAGVRTERDGVIILSNEDPNEARLNSLLKGQGSETEEAGSGDVSVDVTMRAPLGQAPVIMLLFNANDSLGGSASTSRLDTMSISFEVGLNGRISVTETSGLEAGQEDEAQELRKKLSRVLETSQDIGILIEWVLRWKQRRG